MKRVVEILVPAGRKELSELRKVRLRHGVVCLDGNVHLRMQRLRIDNVESLSSPDEVKKSTQLS